MSVSRVLNYTKRCRWVVGVTAPANTLLPGYTLRHFQASVEIKSLHVGLATVPSYFINVAFNSFVELQRNSTSRRLSAARELPFTPPSQRKPPFASIVLRQIIMHLTAQIPSLEATLVVKRCRRGSLMRCCPTGSVENSIPANTGHMADAAPRHLITDS